MIIHVARVLSRVVVTDQLRHTGSFIGAYSSKSTLSVIVLVFLKITAMERSRWRGGGADYKLHKTSSSICIGSGNSSKHSQGKSGKSQGISFLNLSGNPALASGCCTADSSANDLHSLYVISVDCSRGLPAVYLRHLQLRVSGIPPDNVELLGFMPQVTSRRWPWSCTKVIVRMLDVTSQYRCCIRKNSLFTSCCLKCCLYSLAGVKIASINQLRLEPIAR